MHFFRCSLPSDVSEPTLTRTRHRTHLAMCLSHLDEFLALPLHKETSVVMAAHHLRRALQELGSISGHVTNEDILDVIFSDFCIGK